MKCAMVPDEKTALYISLHQIKEDVMQRQWSNRKQGGFFSPQACIDWWWQWRRCTTDDKLIVAIQSNVHLIVLRVIFRMILPMGAL